jgi:hypothetical protein
VTDSPTPPHQPEGSDDDTKRPGKRRPRGDLKLYQVWVQDLDWGDEIDDFNLVAARSASAATRIVLRFRIIDEGDERWFDQRRKAGKWRVTCYGSVPTTPQFVW